MAKIIDGKKIAEELSENLKSEVAKLTAKGITPGLAVVLVGENSASKTYVDRKTKMCSQLGLYAEQHNLADNTTQSELLGLIEGLNQNPKIHGILVQMPLPNHIDEHAIIEAVSPSKDVDAFCKVNVGAIMIGEYEFLPCTPAGIMELIASTNIDISGKDCVVIGRSNIVGKPMAMLLLHQSGTVTICHSKTKNLTEHCKKADILVAAVGKAKFIKADMVKAGAVVIDVGMNRDENGKLCGDVDYDEVSKIAGYITPVPGGVGPMTIAMLMRNTIKAAGGFE